MSDANKQKIAQQLFARGSDAVTKNNFEYAVKCFGDCTRLFPSHLIYRQALRGAERKMYKDNRKGAMMAGARITPAKMKLKTARARGKWQDVINAAEEGLYFNPWENSLLYEIGNACKEMGPEMTATGIWVMETAVDADRTAAASYRLLAELYELDKQYDKAINALAAVAKLDPKDHESASKMRQLAASSTIQRGHYEDAKDFRDALKEGQEGDMAPPIELEGADSFEMRMRRDIASLESKLEDSPNNVNLLVQIADLYRKLGDFEPAADLLERAYEAGGRSDHDLHFQMLDCRIAPLRAEFEHLKTEASSVDKSAPDAKETLARIQARGKELKAQIQQREIEMYTFRTEHNPEDFNSQYELGHRFILQQRFDDAIKALQKGRNDAKHKWEAMLWLGVAFWNKKNFALAEKNLSDAVQALPENDGEARKQVFYYRGRVAEDRNDLAAAIEHYNEIAAADYGFKDVASRLDKLNTQQGGTG